MENRRPLSYYLSFFRNRTPGRRSLKPVITDHVFSGSRHMFSASRSVNCTLSDRYQCRDGVLGVRLGGVAPHSRQVPRRDIVRLAAGSSLGIVTEMTGWKNNGCAYSVTGVCRLTEGHAREV